MSWGVLGRHSVAQPGLAILLVNKHELRLVAGNLILMNLPESRNDDEVTHGRSTCRGTVDRNHARATLALDGIGDKALAIVDVPNMNLLVFSNVGRIKQVFVDGAGTLIVQFTLRHCDTVDF